MATAPARKAIGKADVPQRMAKQTRNVHVHFEAGLPDDDSTDSSDGESSPPAEEEPKSSNEPRTSSNHGISSRIQKRKMPVRRPTAYVSGREPIQPKHDDKEAAEQSSSSDTPPPSSSEGAKKSPTLEQRLRELSVKYKQQDQSPDREPSPALLKKPFTVVRKS